LIAGEGYTLGPGQGFICVRDRHVAHEGGDLILHPQLADDRAADDRNQ
jgi:hypothetical protein